jgi:hypothetical protein
MDGGVAMGVSFRKLACGIEGKWKGGFWGVSWVSGFARFAQGRGFGLWICGLVAWIVGFWVVLMRGWWGGVLQVKGVVHGLHRGWVGCGKVGWRCRAA